MNQTVNLYTDELRPPRQTLQARAALAVLVLAMLMVGVMAGVFKYRNAELAERVARLEQQTAVVERAVAELTSTLENRRPDARLQAELEQVTDNLAQRQRLLEKVETLVLAEDRRFSPVMAALARQIPDGVWLTDVAVASGPDQIILQGRTRAGALVLAYLERLGQEPVFSGTTFGAFRLSRPEESRWLEFHVASERTGEVD